MSKVSGSWRRFAQLANLECISGPGCRSTSFWMLFVDFLHTWQRLTSEGRSSLQRTKMIYYVTQLPRGSWTQSRHSGTRSKLISHLRSRQFGAHVYTWNDVLDRSMFWTATPVWKNLICPYTFYSRSITISSGNAPHASMLTSMNSIYMQHVLIDSRIKTRR